MESSSTFASVLITVLALVSGGDIVSTVRRRPWDFENPGKEAVYVKSIAVNGHIAGNSILVTFLDPDRQQQRGRKKRGQDEENMKVAIKSTEKFQKDEAENGRFLFFVFQFEVFLLLCSSTFTYKFLLLNEYILHL